MLRPRTRRAFLGDTGRLGVAAAGLAIARSGWAVPPYVAAQESAAPESVQVLIGDVSHTYGGLRAQSLAEGEPGWQTSPLVETPFPFTHLSVHWRGRALSAVQVRTSEDGMRWSSWQAPMVVSAPAENPRGEWFTALVSANRGILAQYRFAAGGPAPEQVTLTYLNSVDGPRRPTLRVVGQEPPFKGTDLRTAIITREEWGADESLRVSADGEESWERAYVAPRAIVVHHTATRNFTDDPTADIRSIYAFHAVTQGWGDIGYNALIDPEGWIYEGRRGRDTDPFGRLARDVLSFGVVGAHAFGYNYGSASVALLGNFQEVEPSDAAWQALEELLIFQHRRYQIDPRTTIDFARSSDLWRYGLNALAGHRDCNPTECPGDFVYRRLPALRTRVAERIDGGQLSTRAIVPAAAAARNVWPGAQRYRWQGTPPYDVVFEGFWRHPGEDPVDYLAGYGAEALPEHRTTRETEALFDLPEPGQYTLHVRPAGAAFADRLTFIADRTVVRDNAETEGVHRTGGWTRSASVLEFYGSGYESAPAGSYAQFSWELPVPEDGTYRVQTCWASAPDRSRTAVYTVAQDGTPLATVPLDQTVGGTGGAWATLGTFPFSVGQTCEVTLTATPDETADDGQERVVIADAVRLVLAVDTPS